MIFLIVYHFTLIYAYIYAIFTYMHISLLLYLFHKNQLEWHRIA